MIGHLALSRSLHSHDSAVDGGHPGYVGEERAVLLVPAALGVLPVILVLLLCYKLLCVVTMGCRFVLLCVVTCCYVLLCVDGC